MSKRPAPRYFGIIRGLAIRGDILPEGRLCHVHENAASAIDCERLREPWRAEHDLVTVVKADGGFRVVVSSSERLHQERGAVHPRHRK